MAIQTNRLSAFGDEVNSSSEVNKDVLTDTFNRKHTYLRISITERCKQSNSSSIIL